MLRGRRRRPGPAGDRRRQPHARLRAGAARRRCCRRRGAGVRACLLFLECDDEVLRRRFTETRRRHPLADLPGVGDALAAERVLLAPLKAAADLVHRHQRAVAAGSAPPAGRALRRGTLEQLVDRRGLVRLPARPAARGRSGLRRPLPAQPALCRRRCAPHTGRRSGGAGAHPGRSGVRAVRGRAARRCCCRCCRAIRREGKSYLTIAFGCTGGKHRSVFLAELAERLAARLPAGRRRPMHRELARWPRRHEADHDRSRPGHPRPAGRRVPRGDGARGRPAAA